MPRKLRAPLPPAIDPKEANAPQPAISIGDTPAMPGAVKRGRPSKEEKEARETAAREAAAMKPEDFRPNTLVILTAVCKALKGDPPTSDEIDMVNTPACMVANKYALSNKWGAELALVGSVAIVAQACRQRRAARMAVETMPDRADTARPTPPRPFDVVDGQFMDINP